MSRPELPPLYNGLSPSRDPLSKQTEAGQAGQYYNNRKSVPQYSSVAGEREKRR